MLMLALVLVSIVIALNLMIAEMVCVNVGMDMACMVLGEKIITHCVQELRINLDKMSILSYEIC